MASGGSETIRIPAMETPQLRDGNIVVIMEPEASILLCPCRSQFPKCFAKSFTGDARVVGLKKHLKKSPHTDTEYTFEFACRVSPNCNIDNSKGYNKRNVNAHMKKDHKNVEFVHEDSAVETLSCPHCPKQYVNRIYFEEHLETAHSSELKTVKEAFRKSFPKRPKSPKLEFQDNIERSPSPKRALPQNIAKHLAPKKDAPADCPARNTRSSAKKGLEARPPHTSPSTKKVIKALDQADSPKTQVKRALFGNGSSLEKSLNLKGKTSETRKQRPGLATRGTKTLDPFFSSPPQKDGLSRSKAVENNKTNQPLSDLEGQTKEWTFYEVHVNRADLECLKHNKGRAAYLNDQLIFAYLCTTLAQTSAKVLVVDPTIWHPTHRFHEMELSASNLPTNPKFRGDWEFLVVPVHIGDDHWTLGLATRESFQYYDTLRWQLPERQRSILERIMTAAGADSCRGEYVADGYFRQNDGVNCGALVCILAERWVKREPLDFEPGFLREWRQLAYKMFYEQTQEPSPVVSPGEVFFYSSPPTNSGKHDGWMTQDEEISNFPGSESGICASPPGTAATDSNCADMQKAASSEDGGADKADCGGKVARTDNIRTSNRLVGGDSGRKKAATVPLAHVPPLNRRDRTEVITPATIAPVAPSNAGISGKWAKGEKTKLRKTRSPRRRSAAGGGIVVANAVTSDPTPPPTRRKSPQPQKCAPDSSKSVDPVGSKKENENGNAENMVDKRIREHILSELDRAKDWKHFESVCFEFTAMIRANKFKKNPFALKPYVETAIENEQRVERESKGSPDKPELTTSQLQKLYRRSKKTAMSCIRGEESSTCEIPLITLEEYFQKQLSNDSLSSVEIPEEDKVPLDQFGDILTRPILVGEIFEILKKSRDTAPGADKILYRDIRKIDPDCAILHKIYSRCFLAQMVPNHWKVAETILLYKKGDAMLAENWRPIALSNTIYKVYGHSGKEIVKSHGHN